MDEKKSILIIDDDENICKTLSFVFKKKGFEVETVTTGKLALEKAQARYYNLALLDLKLPDINGLELLTPLKKMHPDMEVMMVTGFGSMESAMRALNMGASSYLTKPLNMDEILSKISDKLEKQTLICAKRRTEKTLRESEEKFRNLFESNLDGIVHVDMEGNFCDCNQAFLNWVGYTMEEIKALTFQQLTPQKWNKEDELAINQIIEKGYCDEFEKEYIKKDGTLLPVSLKGWRIKDEKGDLVGLWAIIRNITERKKKEEEIRLQSEIIENMSEGVYLIKLDDGTIVYTNPAFEEMFGYNHGEMVGEDVSIVNAPSEKTPEETKNAIVGILKDTGEWYGEVLNIKKDGTPFWCYANVSLFDHPDYGRVIVSVHTDITERRKVEEALRENVELEQKVALKTFELKSSEEKIRNLINNISDVLMESDIDGSITFISPQIYDIIEYQPKELLGIQYVELIHPEDKLAYEKLISGTPKAGNKFYLELRLMHKKGYYVPISLKGSIEEVNEKLQFFIVIRDITEKRKIDEMMQSEIKKLKELDQIKGDLIRRISHELKTPLISIFSGSQYLLEHSIDKDKAQTQRIIELIHMGGYRLKSLADNLILAYTIDSKELNLSLARKNIIQIIKNCIEDIVIQAKKRNISINIELLKELYIEVDKSMIKRAISNIFSNAVKNTPTNGNILISTFDHPNYIDIIVKDDGVGLTKKEKPLLFKRFGKIERYGKGMDVDIEGAGLGLYIANGIVKLHNGEIIVKSKGRNKGSTFIIRLQRS